jgi:predicted ATPase with chaperone activity
MNSTVALADEVSPAPPRTPDAPPTPERLSDTGLPLSTISDLLLKILYVQGVASGEQLARSICLPFALLDEQLLLLQQRRLVEVRGTAGHGRGGYQFDLTGGGRDRAQEALSVNSYAGPAPVPLEQYRRWIQAQTIGDVHVDRERIEAGFDEMVIDSEMLNLLGPAINSAKSLFLYGDSGNGKTLIAESISRLLGGAIYIPQAVTTEGQIIVLFDPVYHKPVDATEAADPGTAPGLWRNLEVEYDRRFVRVRRPVAVAGGELTLDQLDLQYDHSTKLYQAPFQMKAGGGVLIIDDFGRQRVPARDLLNRWIVPLEKKRDYLTLHTGSKFPVPFDCLLIFSTNLNPKDLVEEAFLRRIHYKIRVPDPTRSQYEEIFRRICDARGIDYDPSGVDYIYREFYGKRGIAPRSCQPRDILDHLIDYARYLDVPPTLTDQYLDEACSSYFLDLTKLAG